MNAVLIEPLICLRQMQYSDLEIVLAIENAAYTFPWSLNIFCDCLRVGYHAWVLEWEQHMVGYGLMTIGAGEAHILNICIEPKYQHRGFGRFILEHLLMVAKQQAVEIVFLEVRVSNIIAFHLYTDVGFNQVGMRRNYYPAEDNQHEDALILALALR